MDDLRRDALESQLDEGRPAGVVAAALTLYLIGAVAADATFRALAPLPHAAFVVFKPVVVLGCCAIVALVSLSLAAGLIRGGLWAWFGAFHWALACGALASVMLGGRIRGGLPLRDAIALSPHHSALVALSLAMLALLRGRRLRGWIAATSRMGKW